MGGDRRRTPAPDAEATGAEPTGAEAPDAEARDEGYDESAASSGPDGEDVREYQQDKAEGGAAQGGKGRVQ